MEIFTEEKMMSEKCTAAVITVSDKGSRGERIDKSGPLLCSMLAEHDWEVVYTSMVPDEPDQIQAELIHCADELGVDLVLTTGGTGFAPRDNTPEATMAVVDRPTPGIPEAMRAASMRITSKACLSRAAAGIRRQTLIVNLPGSEKAASENLESVIDPIRHGIDMIHSEGSADCATQRAVVRAVCVSEVKGIQKHPVESVFLKVDHGICGDAHAGKWHRQVSLLGKESVDRMQEKLSFELQPGAFAENILTEGICLYELPVGTILKVGSAVGEVTQIGKECHYDCEIRRKAGDCVMPREGIFIRVLEAGEVKAGDEITVMENYVR